MSQNTPELDASELGASELDTSVSPGNGGAFNGSSNGGPSIGKRLVNFADDHLNPIVVKELRQAVRSRFIMVAILLLLFIQLVIVGGFLLGSTGTDFTMGRDVFTALHFLLLTISVIFVPAYVGVRFAAERSAQNVDLMFTTTISPLSIIWGKFLSGVIVTALLFSTAGPFMVLTYMLRGIDVPSILMVVGMDFLTVLAAIQFAILVMSGSTSVVARGGMAIICVFLFVFLISMMGSISMELLSSRTGSGWQDLEMWLYIGGYLLLNGAYHMGMMLASAAVISPPTSNRAVGIRSFLFVTWVVAGLICLLASAATSDSEWVYAWGMVSIVINFIMMLVVIGERDRWGPRVKAMIPVNPIKRLVAFFFYSGSAGGLFLTIFMIVASIVVVAVVDDARNEEMIGHLFIMSMYMLAYALTSVFIVRYLTGGYVKHEATAAITLLLMAVGVMGPALTAFFIDPMGRWDRGVFWRIGNPFGSIMGDDRDMATFAAISFVWATIMFALCMPWMLGQFRAFRRDPVEPVSVEDETRPTLVVHDKTQPLLEDPQVKADI